MQGAIDTILEKIISRKLMAWIVTLVLLLLFAIFGWDVQDRLVDVFRDVTMMYIGTVGVIDAVKAYKGKPSIIGTIAAKFKSNDDEEIIDDP